MKKPLKELLDRIEVKSVKFHRGHDGMQGLNCKLYVDGKFLARVHDDAYGGAFEYDQCIGQDKEGMPLMVDENMYQLLETFKVIYDLKYTSDIGGEAWESEHCWDTLVDHKCNEYQRQKSFNKGVMIKEGNGYTIVGFKYTIPNAIKKWNKEIIVSQLQKIYDDKIADGREVLNTEYLAELGLKT
jgi:hypothetical protein